MAKKPAQRRPAAQQVKRSSLPDGLLNEAPVAYPIATTTITAQQVYHNPRRKPSGDGPWNNEADKVAWVDDATGLGCIMLRQKDGTISGYVGVSPEHPLFGFEADAVPLEISDVAHGGVTYGKACEANHFARVKWGEPIEERYTVCHVTRVRLHQHYRTVQTTDDEFHEDLWWLGFDTNHPGDLVPGDYSRERRKDDIYRDQSYVYANCIALAQKLKSLLDADPNADEMPGAPLGLPSPSNHGGE